MRRRRLRYGRRSSRRLRGEVPKGRGIVGDHQDFQHSVEPTGISRRQMLTRSAVAGGVVWTAPTLLSSPAGAQIEPCPCNGGALTTVKISSTPSRNCGASALSQRGKYNYPCLSALYLCLFEQKYVEIKDQNFENGSARQAEIVLKGGITAISVGVKSSNYYYFADCPDYCENLRAPSGDASLVETGWRIEGTQYNPIGIYTGSVDDKCTAANTGQTVPTVTADNPATPDVDESTMIIQIDAPIELQGNSYARRPLNHMEMSICIPAALTGQCP